jgi:hypothetical protein
MAELSREEVVAIVGPIGDVAIAEIIGTGITKEELSEAHGRVVRDQTAHNPGEPLDPGHIAQAVQILGETATSRGIGRSRLSAGIVMNAVGCMSNFAVRDLITF